MSHELPASQDSAIRHERLSAQDRRLGVWTSSVVAITAIIVIASQIATITGDT
jgi:hypothetical protein